MSRRPLSSPVPAPLPPITVERVTLSGAAKSLRTPYFSIYLIETGRGSVQVDYSSHDYSAPALLCLSTYQKVTFTAGTKTTGWRLHFHANFFCIETHHHAVGCNGVLFNEVYEVPLVSLNGEQRESFSRLVEEMQAELQKTEVANTEIEVCYLKILLIKATRLKLAQQSAEGLAATRRPDLLRRFVERLETSFQQRHAPSDYAELLGVSLKVLAQLVRQHFGKTLSELIRDRIVKHAKWQLLHTLKSVKEIAYEVGFEDEFYFSRLFKRACGCSPAYFREYETAVRGMSHLSMGTGGSSILKAG